MSLATLFLRIAADSSRLIPEVEGASAEAGAKAAEAYQKSFNARMRGKRLFNTTDQAIAQGKKDGEAYAVQLKKSISKAGKISFVALVAGAVVATKLAADFQTQLTRMVTSAGESAKNIGLLSKGLLALSVATGTSTKQLTDGLYLIESAGFHGAEGLSILTAAAKGARTENANLKDVSDALTTGLKDYNLTGKDATRVMNTYIAAVSHGKVNFQDFAASLSTVQALAATAGISLGDLTGVLATMTDHGVSAAEATQQMANTIRNLEAPNNVAVNAMAQLGVSATDVSKNLGVRGLGGTIIYLSNQILKHMGPDGLVLLNSLNQSAAAAKDAQTALSKLPPAAKNVATAYASGKISLKDYRTELKALPADQAALVRQWQAMQDKSKGFSQELKNGTPQAKTYTQELQKMLGGANGLQVALQLGSDGFVTFVKNANATTEAYNKGGKAVSGFSAVQKTANFQFSAAKEALNKIAIEFGAKILPPATKFFGLLANHSGLFEGIVITLGVMTGLLAQIFIIEKVAAFIKVLQGAALAMKALVVATVEEDVAADANPIGLITLAIEALIVAIIAVIYYHKQIFGFLKTAWGGIWGFLKTIGAWFAGPFVNFFVTAGKDIAAPFLWLWHNVIDPAWQAMVNAIKAAVNIIKTIISGIVTAVHAVGAVFVWLYEHVVKPIFAAMAIPIGIFLKINELVFKSIVLAVVFVGKMYLWLYEHAVLPAWHAIVSVAQWAWGILSKVFSAIYGAGLSVGNFFLSLWKNYVVPAFNGIVGFLAGVWDWLYKNFFQHVENAGRDVGNMFIGLWKNYIVPAWSGIVSAISGAWSWIVNNIWNPMKDLVTKTIPGWWDTGVKAIGNIWDGLKNKAKEPIKFFVNTILNDGLIAGFNWVNDKLGKPVKDIDKYKLPANFDVGGYTGDGGKHEPKGVVHGGEWVLTKEQTAAIGVGNLNRAFGRGRLPRQPGDTSQGVALPGYADGGLVDWLKGSWKTLTDPVGSIKGKINDLLKSIPGAGSITTLAKGAVGKIVGGLGTALSKFVGGSNYGPVTPTIKSAQDFIKSQNHHQYVWAGAGPSGADCSGFISEVYNILSGKKSPWGHTFSTSDEAGYFPLAGHGVFTAGWANPGERGGGDVGHTAGNLAGLAFESGGAGGDMHFGARSTSVDSFAHVGHMKGYSGGGMVTNDHGVHVHLDGARLTAQEQWAQLNAVVGRHLRTIG